MNDDIPMLTSRVTANCQTAVNLGLVIEQASHERPGKNCKLCNMQEQTEWFYINSGRKLRRYPLMKKGPALDGENRMALGIVESNRAGDTPIWIIR
jgi:hypothetical protein